MRAVVVIDGHSYGVLSLTVEQNAHGSADTATITLSRKECPDFTQTLNAKAQAATVYVPVALYFGLFQGQPPTQNLSISGLTKIFSGFADMYDVDISPEQDAVTFHCRSYAGRLVDDRITVLSSNQKTTDFVSAIAARYGLTVNIGVSPKAVPTTVGDVYRNEFAVGIQNKRIWDVLLDFAQIDDVDVWVQGNTLNYVAPSLVKRNRIDLTLGTDFNDPVMSHSLNGSQAIRVEVRTYDTHTRIASIQRVETDPFGYVTVTNSSKVVTSSPQFGTPVVNTTSISASGVVTNTQAVTLGGNKVGREGGAAPTTNGPLVYKFYEPGLTQDQANKKAKALWRQISMHLFTGTIRLPLWRKEFAALSITSLLVLHGMPMRGFNGQMWPRKVTLTAGMEVEPSFAIDFASVALPVGDV